MLRYHRQMLTAVTGRNKLLMPLHCAKEHTHARTYVNDSQVRACTQELELCNRQRIKILYYLMFLTFKTQFKRERFNMTIK